MVTAAAGKEMEWASYIRIKHEEERREASWKEPEGRVFSATSRTDVAARLVELRDQILTGSASFADLAAAPPPAAAATYTSTCPAYALCRLLDRVSDPGEPEALAKEELDSVEVLSSQDYVTSPRSTASQALLRSFSSVVTQPKQFS